MSMRKDSLTRLLQSASTPRFGKEKGKESLVMNASMQQLPRLRTSTVRVTSNEGSTGSEQYSTTSRPSTPTSASANLLRMTSKAGLKSLDTSSNSSLRSISKTVPDLPGPPVPPKNVFRLKAPKPLKLVEKTAAVPLEQQPSGSRETATPSYETQFRRRRGDLLHRLGESVPYMQAYDTTSLQFDALTTRLLEYVCEPGTPCFYKFKNKSAVTTVLDLGCGPQLRWIMTAARFWPSARIIGVDCIRPNLELQIPYNVEFVQGNFLNGLPTIEAGSVDFVRMSCLGTSIPEKYWSVVLTEVRRVLRIGGAIEVVDDELIRVYPEYSPEERGVSELGSRFSLASTESGGKKGGLHPIDRYFSRMLVDKYRMPETPHRTIDTEMESVFGANDRKHFRVELPPPNFKIVETEETRWGGNLFQAIRGRKDGGPAPPDPPVKTQRVMGSTLAGERIGDPFLVFYPHGLCRLDASEVRMAACGSMHKVLSCRASLIDFMVGPGVEGEEVRELGDMLWEYERFYQKLPNLPNPPGDDWDDFDEDHKGSGKETHAAHRSSTDSCDSGYASLHSYGSDKMARGRKPSVSIASDSNDCTMVRCFRVFHATKV